MEKTLRKKFICISFSVVFFVLTSMAFLINVANYNQMLSNADTLIDLISDNDGVFPESINSWNKNFSDETRFSTRFFSISIANNGDLLEVDTKNIYMVNENVAEEFARNVLNSNTFQGFVDNYRYKVIEKEHVSIVFFIDCFEELASFDLFLITSIYIVLIALLLVLLLLFLLSKIAIKPIVDNFKKQQEFVTNITHELKTPLAIIKTNNAVIEMENGKSEWTNNINNEVTKFNDLINYILSLAKSEQKVVVKNNFDLSICVNDMIDSFSVLANDSNIRLFSQVSDGIFYNGDESSIRMLLSILIENAIKYGVVDTDINIELKKVKSRINLRVSNYASGLIVGNYQMLFERFYRLDDSRNSKTGGYGIGLSIAKTIVINHGGSIESRSLDGEIIEFEINF